jgi:hypothetical protein
MGAEIKRIVKLPPDDMNTHEPPAGATMNSLL